MMKFTVLHGYRPRDVYETGYDDTWDITPTPFPTEPLRFDSSEKADEICRNLNEAYRQGVADSIAPPTRRLGAV